MSNLTRVTLLSTVLLVSLPALAGAVPQRHAASGDLVEVVVTLDAPPLTSVAPRSLLTAPASYRKRLASEQGDMEARLRDQIPGFAVRRRYSVVVDGLDILVPRSEVATLQGTDGVARVYPSVSYHALRSSSPGFIGAPALWGPKLATAGRGIKIGIIDDGVDRTHPYFNPRGYRMPRGFPKGRRAFTSTKVIVARAFAPRRPIWRYAHRPFDPINSQHATHVAGIAAGNYRTRARGSRLSGVAPKAYIGNYKVLTIPTGGFGLNGNSPEIVAAIEAAVRDRMDVINLSIGEAEIDPRHDIVAAALNGAAAAGVIPVVAAGNSYEEFGAGSVTSPANSTRAISVAAEDQDLPSIASFSSGGPTPLSLLMQPDVTAPGVDVLSSIPRRVGLWARLSGTRMATPHVAGAAALLRQRHPGWTVEQVKSALVQTAEPAYSSGAEARSTRQGGGTVNLVRADSPLLFASPTGLSFGFASPGGPAQVRTTVLTNAGGGAGQWAVSVVQQQPAAGASILVPPTGATQIDHSGFIVLAGAGQQRRIPYWFRVATPALGQAQATPLTRTGTYRGDTRGRPSLVD